MTNARPFRALDRPTASVILIAALLYLFLLVGCEVGETDGAPDDAAVPSSVAAIDFEVDPYFPNTLPNDWIVGQVAGIAVDSRDHVWVAHRPVTLSALRAGAAQEPPIAMCCVPAPPILELDPEGNVVQGWGGPSQNGEHDWPQEEHGIFVDHEDNVWIGGGAANAAISGHYVLKFTRDGEFLFQIGQGDGPEATGGSTDIETLGGPAAMHVDPEENEVYIADGYQNRRVIVFDAETGEYRRHWGAFGNEPEDGNDDAAQQFQGPVHGIAVSRDGLVYVVDRSANRIQVFRRDGTYVDELVIRPETGSMGSAWDVALSRDPDETYLYVPDGVNKTVWVVDRRNLEVVNNFARGGRWAGELGWVHNVAVDSRGNIFVSEVETGKRFQKFIPRN
jgi:DNA-binding beta-propeller fold protein YncE